jgi:23S rRNA (adenine2503-C2)-methyltransferase
MIKSKPLVYDLELSEIEEILRQWGEKPYRSHQIWQGLYNNLWIHPEEFTNLSRSTRDNLANIINFSIIQPIEKVYSKDQKTEKTLFRLHDDQTIETVFMKYRNRNTLCISTQVGCAMGCVFCATGRMGLHRNLSSGEIIAQVLYYASLLSKMQENLTNIVVMGMGEPFHNYEAALSAINRLNDHEGFNFGERRFTISTVGLVPMIKKFTNEKRQINLAISLHAADNDLRTTLVPINKKFPIEEVLSSCHDYVNQTRRRVTFEWALINDLNDTPQQANLLISKLHGLLCHVNLIPLNPSGYYMGRGSTPERAEAFKSLLVKAGIPCSIRLRRGIDIQAGCGQLNDHGKD